MSLCCGVCCLQPRYENPSLLRISRSLLAMNGLPRCSRFVVLKRRKCPTKSPLTARGHVCTLFRSRRHSGGSQQNEPAFLSFSAVISFAASWRTFGGDLMSFATFQYFRCRVQRIMRTWMPESHAEVEKRTKQNEKHQGFEAAGGYSQVVRDACSNICARDYSGSPRFGYVLHDIKDRWEGESRFVRLYVLVAIANRPAKLAASNIDTRTAMLHHASNSTTLIPFAKSIGSPRRIASAEALISVSGYCWCG